MDEREKPLVFIDREGKPGGGKGLLISKDLTFTLSGLRQYLMTYEYVLDSTEEIRRNSNSANSDLSDFGVGMVNEWKHNPSGDIRDE